MLVESSAGLKADVLVDLVEEVLQDLQVELLDFLDVGRALVFAEPRGHSTLAIIVLLLNFIALPLYSNTRSLLLRQPTNHAIGCYYLTRPRERKYIITITMVSIHNVLTILLAFIAP